MSIELFARSFLVRGFGLLAFSREAAVCAVGRAFPFVSSLGEASPNIALFTSCFLCNIRTFEKE